MLSRIPYMRWAKQFAHRGDFRLTQSAVPPIDWSELGYDPSQLELFRYHTYGEQRMFANLAAMWAFAEDEILIAASATHAHYCFAASRVEPGGTILCEHPGYFPLRDALSHMQVDVVPFVRRFEDGYRLPADELRRAARETGARLLMVTQLHNPTGVALRPEDEDLLVELADTTGVEVLCDEIYRPFLEPDPGPLHARHPRIVSVMGLNKVHGLPQIRVGWGFARPERIDEARCLLDATTVHNSCLTDQVADFAVTQMPRLERRARAISRAGWEVLSPWLDASPLECVPPAGGMVCFPRVPDRFASGDVFCERALAECGVNITPGSFFGEPRHVRLGFGVAPEVLAEALGRLERVVA